MLGKIISFIVCSIGIILPYRLRILYAEIIGWSVHFFYTGYYGTLNYILHELKKNQKVDPNDK